MSLHVWQNLTSDGAVRWLKYSFDPGKANTLAVRLDDGSWLVVSPSVGSPEGVYDALAKDGTVTALLAPNGFHHLGQSAWRKRFPTAISYASDDARARLSKKCPGVTYESVNRLTERLPARVGILLPDGMKAPDLLVHATSAGTTVWHTGDLVSNTTAEDMPLHWRLLMTVFGAGTGFRFNTMPAMIYLRDRAAWKRSVLAAIEKAPPAVLLPAHGNPLADNVAEKTRHILRG